ncbi:hypothetical protein E2C01_086765 [Portunus trituberculatus]|uniref:Uncharacterized protein n=1 Tax=Portunus trituberculatus TaxID=210409 RepID=A0A5B7JA65_PORTR|nr:hypothetical protein [Portunus trituberculatus]
MSRDAGGTSFVLTRNRILWRDGAVWTSNAPCQRKVGTLLSPPSICLPPAPLVLPFNPQPALSLNGSLMDCRAHQSRSIFPNLLNDEKNHAW